MNRNLSMIRLGEDEKGRLTFRRVGTARSCGSILLEPLRRVRHLPKVVGQYRITFVEDGHDRYPAPGIKFCLRRVSLRPHGADRARVRGPR